MTKEIKIELKNEEDQTVVFKQTRVKARKVREALELQIAIERDGMTVENLDKMVDYVAGIFPKSDKLTADTIWDGLESWELMPTVQRVVSEVMGTEENLTESQSQLEKP
ncbi:hypothetical protein P7H75_14050 [Vagococcus carniphilus]|uniref:phage tail assembly chaperone G n=1 Tax=Vagococcus carniphilus TaxID=218144 RepID=UPI00288FFC19|nr:hypothetical protein [Vagococcus carniphilus]MDT2815978.1 hypothetical protein [Vagococcus carniphilus]